MIHQKISSREVGRHKHDEHEFFLPLQGEISVTSNTPRIAPNGTSESEETVKAGPGKMLYVPPDLDHSFKSSAQGSGERLIWLISEKLWKKHVDEIYRPCIFPINSLAKELLFYLLIHQDTKGAPHFISALIETLNESLSSAQLEKKALHSEHLAGRVKDERVARTLDLIESELASLSLSEIAKRSGLSLRNFNRLFLNELGLSPKDYLLLRRIEKAKRLLSETQMTVTDISLEVGYQSLSKFIDAFKRISGSLPSDFRKSNPKRRS